MSEVMFSIDQVRDMMDKARAEEREAINIGYLRDQFAMSALTGFMAVPDDRTCSFDKLIKEGLTRKEWQEKIMRDDARYMYRMADAMLAARGKKP